MKKEEAVSNNSTPLPMPIAQASSSSLSSAAIESLRRQEEQWTLFQLHNILQLVGCKVQDARRISEDLFRESGVGKNDVWRVSRYDFLEKVSTHLQRSFGHLYTHPNSFSVYLYTDLIISPFRLLSEQARLFAPGVLLLLCFLAAPPAAGRAHLRLFLPHGRWNFISSHWHPTLCSRRARLCRTPCVYLLWFANTYCSLGITTVISTDSIRHVLRAVMSEESNPVLWASTYQTDRCINDDTLKPKAKVSYPERA